jgi:hypothetical protein
MMRFVLLLHVPRRSPSSARERTTSARRRAGSRKGNGGVRRLSDFEPGATRRAVAS